MASVEDPRFLIRFWGVRGSYPTPGTHTLRHGGNTACIEVRAGKHTLIFDAGTGIIGLGSMLMRLADNQAPLNIALFITHGHGDHLIGFPFFAPLFEARTCIHFFGPRMAGKSIEELIIPLMSPPYFPVDVRQLPSQRVFHTIADEECIIWHASGEAPVLYSKIRERKPGEVCVRVKFTTSHPSDGAAIYRVEYAGHSVVYATDVEWSHGCEQDVLEFVSGADVLIHDAQYTKRDYQAVKQGYGHSTVDMAIEAAQAAQVRKLILFHHEPTYDDNQLDTMEAEAQSRFKWTRSAYEGMEIDLLA